MPTVCILKTRLKHYPYEPMNRLTSLAWATNGFPIASFAYTLFMGKRAGWRLAIPLNFQKHVATEIQEVSLICRPEARQHVAGAGVIRACLQNAWVRRRGIWSGSTAELPEYPRSGL